MSDHVFSLRPLSSQCRESLCLEDYEEAWDRHQHIQFERTGREALGSDFENFRRTVWGSSSYADGMKIRVGGEKGQVFSWSDVAAEGRIEYTDVQGLMELGLVEFLVPSHRCISSRVPASEASYPIRNRRDFKALLREMQNLRPMHGEGMGNIFLPLCLPDVGSTSEEAPKAEEPVSLAQERSEADPCNGGEVDYYDDDLGQAVCYEEERPLLGGVLAMGMENLLASTVGRGLGYALAKGASEIGRVAMEAE